jgi:hypothetical protein
MVDGVGSGVASGVMVDGVVVDGVMANSVAENESVLLC